MLLSYLPGVINQQKGEQYYLASQRRAPLPPRLEEACCRVITSTRPFNHSLGDLLLIPPSTAMPNKNALSRSKLGLDVYLDETLLSLVTQSTNLMLTSAYSGL